MKPLKLTMQAFGPYPENVVIDFEQLQSGLFLLSGPTGAGKTTIFDAIKYALYGNMSGETREAKSSRNCSAADDTPTFVELCFEHEGQVYRAYRQPAQRRRKKIRNAQGEYDFTEDPEKVSLECITTGKSLAGKTREMSDCIEEILKVTSDQFGRIVMIAQGEFSAILHANTEERTELFRKVFGTEAFKYIQEALVDQDNRINSALKHSDTQVTQVVSQFVVSQDSPSFGVYQNLKAQSDACYRSAEYQQLLAQVLQEDAEAKKALGSQMDETKKLLEDINQKIGAAAQVEQNRRALERSQTWIEQNQVAVEQAQTSFKDLQKQQPSFDLLLADIAKLEGVLPDYDKLEDLTKEIEKQRNNQEKALAEKDHWEQSLQTAQETLATITEGLQGFENLDVDEEKANQEQTSLELRAQELSKCKQLKEEMQQAQQKAEQSREAAKKAIVAAQEAAGCYTRSQAQYNASIAGVLAQELAQGEPCPVCGSTEHPKLAALSPEAKTKEELEKLKEAADLAQQDSDESSSIAAANQASLEAAQKSCFSQAQSLLNIASFEEYDDSYKRALKELREQADALKKRQEEIAASKQKRQQLVNQRESAEQQKQRSDDALKEATQALKEADIVCSQLAATAQTTQERLEYANKAEVSQLINSKRAQHQAFQNDLESARKQAEDLRSELTSHQTLVQEKQDALKDAPLIDSAALENQREELRQETQKQESSLAALQSSLDMNQSISKQLESLAEQRKALEEQREIVHTMSEMASGKKAGSLGKVSFETYVQGVYFDQILQAANQRLQEMSRSQYSLVRRVDKTNDKTKTGLDLNVYDRHAGQERDVKTLSGGETFMASLSLALGFSDVIQAQAGGVQIDAMFIDEGFGSLDSDSCQTAMNVFDQLVAGNRLIGIISHVDELKQRIPRQIVVTKTESGSRVSLEL